jgi:hypothetical protein
LAAKKTTKTTKTTKNTKTTRTTNKKKGRNIFLIILASVVVLLALIAFLTNRANSKAFLNQNIDLQVQSFPAEGRGHVDGSVTYKTFPPTSGDHNPIPARYGFYEEAVPFENLVHSLEHGDIVIYYNKSKLNEQDMNGLKEISKITHIGSGVEVVPNSDIDKPIILTAWTKMLKLDKYDEAKIKQFMYDYIYDGPEKVPMLK